MERIADLRFDGSAGPDRVGLGALRRRAQYQIAVAYPSAHTQGGSGSEHAVPAAILEALHAATAASSTSSVPAAPTSTSAGM